MLQTGFVDLDLMTYRGKTNLAVLGVTRSPPDQCSRETTVVPPFAELTCSNHIKLN
jgi:hypothetical protein